MLALQALGRGYAANQGWLPLVPGWGPFGGHYHIRWGHLPLVLGLWPLNWNYVPSQYWPPLQGGTPHKETEFSSRKKTVPIVVQASPQGECSRYPSVSVYHLVVLWEAAFSFSELFLKTQCVCPFHDGWFMSTPAHWAFSRFLPPSQFTQSHLDQRFLVSRWKNVSKGNILLMWKRWNKYRAEAPKGIKIDKFKNCLKQWKKVLIGVLHQMESTLKVTEV